MQALVSQMIGTIYCQHLSTLTNCLLCLVIHKNCNVWLGQITHTQGQMVCNTILTMFQLFSQCHCMSLQPLRYLLCLVAVKFIQKACLIAYDVNLHILEFNHSLKTSFIPFFWLQITSIQSLIGCTGRRWIMGVISQLEDGHFFLEDLTAAVPVNLCNAISLPSLTFLLHMLMELSMEDMEFFFFFYFVS